MGIRTSKKDIIWNYVGIIMSMASNFLLLPFMMYYINADYLGLWYVYLSIGGIVFLFDFGFNPTLARNIAYCWSGAKQLNPEGVQFVEEGEPNYDLLCKVIDTCKKIYLIISLLALTVLLTVGSGYIYYVSREVFNSTVIVSWIIYSIAIFLNLYYGYYATFLRGVGAVADYNKINIIARSIQIVVSITLMAFSFGIIAVSSAYLLYGFLLRLLSKKKFYLYRNIGKHIKNITKSTTKDEIKNLFSVIWHNAWRDGVVSLSNYSANQASTLIASFFLSLKDTGTYSISVQLITAIATISAALYTAYQPALQSAYINKKKKESEKLMGKAMVTYTFLFFISLLILLTIGIPALKIIKPTTVFNKTIIISIGVYNYFYRRQSYYASFISNTNQVPYMKSYLISGIIGIVLSIFLMDIANFGVYGLILGQFIPQLVYNCWKWPKVAFQMMDSSSTRILKVGFYEISKEVNRRFTK